MEKIKLGGLVVWVALLISPGQTRNPGLRMRVSTKGLDYAGQLFLKHLGDSLTKHRFPAKRDSSDIGIGKVDYTIQNLRITSFVVPKLHIYTKNGALMLQLIGASIKTDADWKYDAKLLLKSRKKRSWFRRVVRHVRHVVRQVPHAARNIVQHVKKLRKYITVRDHGRVEASMSSVNLHFTMFLGVGNSGTPRLDASRCGNGIGSFDIHIKGGGIKEAIYNLILEAVKEQAKKSISDSLCKDAIHAINAAGRQLMDFQVKVPMDYNMELDYSLIGSPKVAQNYVETNHKGEVFTKGHEGEHPFGAQLLPLISPTETHMLDVQLSEYIIRTMLDSLHQDNRLQIKVTKDDLPPNEQKRLATSCQFSELCIGLILPKVQQLYPNSYIEIEAKSTKSPQVQITPQSLSSTVTGNMDYFLRNSNGTKKFLFSTEAIVHLTINNLKVKGDEWITATVKELNPVIRVVKSDIGIIQSTMMTFLFNLCSRHFFVPHLNKLAANGIRIPALNGFHLVSPNIALQKGAILLTTDVKYK